MDDHCRRCFDMLDTKHPELGFRSHKRVQRVHILVPLILFPLILNTWHRNVVVDLTDVRKDDDIKNRRTRGAAGARTSQRSPSKDKSSPTSWRRHQRPATLSSVHVWRCWAPAVSAAIICSVECRTFSPIPDMCFPDICPGRPDTSPKTAIADIWPST